MSDTLLFMIIVTGVIIAYDIYIILKEGKYYSISAYVIRGSRRYPLIVLATGILLGHFFWSMNTFDYAPKEYLLQRCKAVINE